MSFLFGDLSPAPFATNFLEELRDAIDFASAIAESDQLIATAPTTREDLRRRADEELATLTALVSAMLAASDAANKGAGDGVTSRLATDLAAVIAERRHAAEASVRAKLASDIAALEAATVAAREDYFPTLEEYLLAREPPGTTQTIRVELVVGAKKDQHRYVGELTGAADLGLAWTIEMAVPEAAPWAGPVRVDHVVENLSISTPQLAGLIKKEVKRKEQRLDRYLVTTIVDDGAEVRLELRADVRERDGFVLVANVAGGSVTLEKTGAEGDPTIGSFEVAAEDEKGLLDLAAKMRAKLRELPKKRLVAASFDDLPFDGTSPDGQPKLVGVVSHLVEKLAPTAIEIDARSRSVDELLLRRTLDDGRREELFLPKARLRERLEPLDATHTELFAAVARVLAPASAAPRAATPEPAPQIRSEVQPSVPALIRRKSGNIAAVVVEKPKPADNTELRSTVDHIRSIANEGHLPEAYRQYAMLFGTSAFASCGPEGQRETLRLMIFETVPTSSDEMRAAHRAALPFLQALVLDRRDAADYEMVGMSYLALEEREKAAEMFKKALEIERARDPESDLLGKLMLRVSELDL